MSACFTAATRRITTDARRQNAALVELTLANDGSQTAVFHVFDRLHLDRLPRRCAVAPREALKEVWQPVAGGAYDLWVMGPDGFRRHFTGNARR